LAENGPVGSTVCWWNAAQAAIFNASMTALSNAHYSGVVEAYNFTSIRNLVDVGGGHGRLISMILKAYPKMRGVLYDLPHASEGGRKGIGEAGLADRCEVISVTFSNQYLRGATPTFSLVRSMTGTMMRRWRS
jgi:O-methyltransferase domain